MNKLYFLIGLPRSGKSTLANQWARYFISFMPNGVIDDTSYDSTPRVVVCADDIRYACGHRWNGYVEPYINATKLIMIRSLLRKHDVLVDGTHTTSKSIMELLTINRHAIPYFVNTKPDICKQRAKESNQDDLLPVIDRMKIQIDQLTFDNTSIYTAIDNMRKNISDIRISD